MSTTDWQSTAPAMRILENEHRYLSSLMNEWHAIVREIENDRYEAEEARSAFRELCRLLVEFKAPLMKHTAKEEQFFFPLLGRHIGFDQGPLVSIQHEHEEIATYIDHFLYHAEHAEQAGELTPVRMKALVREAGEAFEVLTVHFVKEETVLFPMTTRVMKKAEREELADQLHTLIVD